MDSFSVRATYDSVELFARVASEAQGDQANNTYCDGAGWASRLGGSNYDLDSGPSHITNDGTRNLDLDIYGYNETAKAMQVSIE